MLTRAEPTNGLSRVGGLVKSLATSEDEGPAVVAAVAAAGEPFGFFLAPCRLACLLEGVWEDVLDMGRA
jgi:hypothetical protein